MILVTGATGFIGSHLVRRLLREGHAVRCLVRATSDTSRLAGAELVPGDLTGSLTGVADGCRAVVHAGALVSDWATVAEIEAVNVGGTRRVLEAAAATERFVHLSSTDVHGAGNWYARTKRAAEAEVGRLAPHAVILRPATVYGPGSTEVVGEIARAIRGRHMVLIDRGRADAGLCYVENLVDAVLLALDGEPGAYDISDGLDVTWRRFTDDLARGLGCPPPRWSLPLWLANGLAFGLEQGYRALRRATGVSTRPLLSRQAVHVLGRDQRFDTTAAQLRLGWRPRVDYASGLAATLAWLRAEA